MKRLRHPVRAIREPFGTAGLIVAMIALVAALGGTALAAAKLNSTQKKEVEKIAKKFAGKAGVAGVNGTNGTNGAPGAGGKEGGAGKEGAAGKAGESVTNTAIPVGDAARCNKLGGAEFKVGSGTPTKVCNGQTGFTKVLPSGETEMGAWSVTPVQVQTPGIVIGTGAISFVIPVAAAPTLVYIRSEPEDCSAKPEPEKAECEAKQQEQAEDCPGTAAEPQAKKGFLCLYPTNEFETTFNPGASEALAFGAHLAFNSTDPGFPIGGSWAVTAE
jgi:hypothetical protein